MNENFSKLLEALFQRTDPRQVPPPKPVPPPATPPSRRNAAERRREWFAEFAAKEVMPLLDKVAETAKKHGATAHTRLAETDGGLLAELELVRGRLPQGARPPRLTIYAAEGEPPVMVEFTGTFPHVGALGGFGGEVDYDPVYPSQVEEKILDFIALVNGAGARLK
jgi:hypothetical protein